MSDCLITLDIDWAPDFIVEDVAQLLRQAQVRATWFATHEQTALQILREDSDLFEIGVHPNFLPGSTQGTTPEEILANLLAIVPEAVSVRCHSAMQSGRILKLFTDSSRLRIDASVMMPGLENIRPVRYGLEGRSLFRVLNFWSDDYEMSQTDPCWLTEPHLAVPGVKVLVFHPIHVYLNAAHIGQYEETKRHIPTLHTATAADLDPFVREGIGVRTLFTQFVDHVRSSGRGLRLKDLLPLE